MEMTGEQRIPASRQVVWDALNDPEVLRRCIPGCQELTRNADDTMSAVSVVKVGPISARFQGQVTLSDLDPPNGYRISGEGQGGVAGHAAGSAWVRLTDDGDGTLLRYEVAAQIGGKLAQLGGRMIDATARSMAAAFFRQFAAELAGTGKPEVAAQSAATKPSAPPKAAVSGAAAYGASAAPAGRWAYLAAGLVAGALAVLALAPDPTRAPADIATVSIILSALAGGLLGRLSGGQVTIIIERAAATPD